MTDDARASLTAAVGLCRDRRLVTPELHGRNDFYGHATLLKQYASLPRRRPLFAVIEHAPFMDDWLSDDEFHPFFGRVFCCSERRAQWYETLQRETPRFVPIGPFTAYVPEAARPNPPDGRRRLVGFPAHSTHHVEARYEVEAFADTLERAPGTWDEVWVCLYWRDVLRGLAEPFARRGFRVVSAGHIYDPGFLPRLVEILRSADLVVTNEVGSHIPYAAYEGCPVWVVRGEVEYIADQNILARDVSSSDERHRLRARVFELFGTPHEELTLEQVAFADEMLSPGCVRSPEELRALLEEAEELYRANVLVLERSVRRLRAWGRWRRAALAQAVPRRSAAR